MNTAEIEKILGRAPRPKPPGILKQQLRAQALRAPRINSQVPRNARPAGSWLGRWWPALAPTAVSLACAAVLSVQHGEIQKLKHALSTSNQQRTGSAGLKPELSAHSRNAASEPSSEVDELNRLRNLAASLSTEVAGLEQMRAQNDQLRAQLAAASAAVLSAEETGALEQARDRASSIQCVNNLKQLGLAVKIWSLDNGDLTPPNVLCLSNEIGSFKILVCPADTARQPARDPLSFTPANCSYEYLAPSSPDNEPNRITFRCPIHGNVGLCDGSVQMEVAKKHPEQIVQKDGKLYCGPPASDNAPPPDSTNPNQ